MTHEISCAKCGRKVLDLGKPWDLKGWTTVTTINHDCSLSMFRICPDHAEWTVIGHPGNQEVRRCALMTGP